MVSFPPSVKTIQIGLILRHQTLNLNLDWGFYPEPKPGKGSVIRPRLPKIPTSAPGSGVSIFGPDQGLPRISPKLAGLWRNRFWEENTGKHGVFGQEGAPFWNRYKKTTQSLFFLQRREQNPQFVASCSHDQAYLHFWPFLAHWLRL